MQYLMRNLVMLHIAALALYLVWVHGGTRVEHLHGVPWITLLLIDVLLLCPPVRKNEILAMAHRRVRHNLVRDPLFYVGLALCGLLLFQWANGGGDPRPDPTGTRWIYAQPRFPWLPSSVIPAEARQQLFWFPPVWVALLAVRHGVMRAGQRRLMQILTWNGALLAVFGFVQNVTGTRALYGMTPLEGYFFATFGYPNVAGAFFTLLFAVSVGIWFQAAMDRETRNGSVLLLVPVALNFAGAIGTLSRAAILLSSALLVFCAGYCLFSAWPHLGRAGRLRLKIIGPMCLLTAAAVWLAVPDSSLRKELATIRPATFFDDAIGTRIIQFRSSWDIFKDHPLFGVGGWGYRHQVRDYVTPEEYKMMVSGKGMANVHNDILQFLAEHGAIGFGLMLAAVGLLLVPLWRGVHRALNAPFESEASPLLHNPAVAWCVLAGTSATVVHSLIDLPFRSPAVLMTWTLVLACTPAFLPSRKAPVRLDG